MEHPQKVLRVNQGTLLESVDVVGAILWALTAKIWQSYPKSTFDGGSRCPAWLDIMFSPFVPRGGEKIGF